MLSRLHLPAVLALDLLLFGAALGLRSTARPLPPQKPAPDLHLHWVRDLPPLEATWPDQPRFTSDAARRPVPAGSLVLVSCARSDSVLAFDVASGAFRWRFACDGPVRFAPAVWRGRAFAASDDGHLYCLDLATGRLRWQFRGAPGERRILGNERLISTWPARGAPVVACGTVYFAAGIWPFMGIFLHALDADTGEVRWSNSGDGSLFIKQPHQADAFAGIAPQGSLVVAGDRLLVPCGRSLPACFDRHTGKLLHYRLADNSKKGGGPDLAVGTGVYLNGGGVFDLAHGDHLGPVAGPAVLAGGLLFSVSGSTLRGFDLDDRPPPFVGPLPKTRARKPLPGESWLGTPFGQTSVPATTVLLPAGERLFGAGPGVVYGLPLPLTGESRLSWQAPIEGTPVHLAFAGGRLLVSTREGRLYCFAPGTGRTRRHLLEPTSLPPSRPEVELLARKVLDASGVRAGHAVLWGAGSGELASELLRRTDLRLVVVEADARRAADLRRRLHAANVDGRRLAVLPASAHLPPYLCSLMAGADLAGIEVDRAFLDTLFRSLRPHGGVACLPLDAGQRAVLAEWARGEPTARVRTAEGLTLLSREGALPGAGNWTHEHADAANTRVSRDRLVKAPLGLLWFGGPSHQGILPRHGHGPVPQAVDGRLIIEGSNGLRAMDVYTGRLLWETSLPGLGKAYDNLSHQPGANAAGSNYVSTAQGIFVAHGREGLRLDPATGQVVQRYRLPPLPGEKEPPEWTFLHVAGPYLIGGAGKPPPAKGLKGKLTLRGAESSRRLSVLDRDSGRLLWQTEARWTWRHNALCAGNGRLFAVDREPVGLLTRFLKKKKDAKVAPVKGFLRAFDLATGKRLWTETSGVFGTWLSYSVEHDVLVEAGLMARDTLFDEARGMRAFAGHGGRVLWQHKEYYGPALIHGDRILKGGDASSGSGTACDLRTGKPFLVPDPLTGRPREWKWVRTYGCNTPAACENLVLFRSGAAGFYDLAGDSGTGNLGGFRSSCTMNLIAAGGVLTIPDYTRTCTCSYQHQASVGLVHLPEADLWTFSTRRDVDEVVRQVGVNLAAPGSRRADNGTLWLEHPPAGGPAPRLSVTTTPARPDTFRWHTAQVQGDRLPWVAGSGLRGLRELRVRLGPDSAPQRRYTVRLVFLEPDRLPAGRRLFDVALQGETRLRRLDVSREAGGPGRPLVREVKGVLVRRDLVVTLTPCADSPTPAAVLSGVEVLAEGW